MQLIVVFKIKCEKGELSEQYLSNGDRNFHVGDRIVLRKPIKIKTEKVYSNGDVGTIKEFVNGKAVIALDNGTIRNAPTGMKKLI